MLMEVEKDLKILHCVSVFEDGPASEKEREMDFPLDAPEGAWSCGHLAFSLLELTSDFWPPELSENVLCV